MRFMLPFIIGYICCLISCQETAEYTSQSQILRTEVFKGKTEQYNPHNNLYFGDLHIHTGWSFDAYMSDVRVTPDEAYQFGKGEPMPHVTGREVQMTRPLDFMAVSDHAEYMGALIQMTEKESPFYDLKEAANIRSDDRETVIKQLRKLQFSIATNWPNEGLIQPENLKSTWHKMVEAADRHYEPGVFTTFPAYEWTSSPAVYSSLIFGPRYARNLHRNVIFKGDKVSALPFSSFDSQNPEKLWEWMDLQRDQGVELMAIPHNANISDGRMYAMATYDGNALTKEYIKNRRRNEPVNEVVQIKGQSMTHPLLSPKDEFADFEIYEFALGQGDPRKEVEPSGGYVREALKNGLSIQEKLGVNPFQFGLIGSSDSHNGGPNVEEFNNIGKSGIKDITPEVRLSKEVGGVRNRKSSVAGLAAVWAKENTREAIFEALERKEVYATSGTRIRLRFFGSSDFNDFTFDHNNWDSLAYTLGVPMGSVLTNLSVAPSFLIAAQKDADGANLDRIQIIKGWVEKDGNTHEQIFDVAWSDDRPKDENGVKPVPSTVDLSTASYTNEYGSVMLQAIWTDTDFDPSLSAFYYVRVLEIPTPRWSTFDAVAIKTELPDDVDHSIQERAWSSPIWYLPK